MSSVGCDAEARRGRGRPRMTVPVEQLEVLTVPQAYALLRKWGRPMSRTRITQAIRLERLPAQVDDLRHDRFGQPLLVIYKRDLRRWIDGYLRPLRVRVPA